MEISIPLDKLAIGKKYSTIKEYLFVNGSNSKTLIHTGEALSWQFDNVQTNTISITAKDSRGLTKTISKSFVLKPYANPTIQNAELTRQGGVGTTANLLINGTFKVVDFREGNSNQITALQYKIGDGEWVDKFTAISQNYSQGTYQNTTANLISGFTLGEEYEVQVKVTDKLKSVTTLVVVNNGKVTFAVDRVNHTLGLNCFPGTEEGVYVNDDLYYKGNPILTKEGLLNFFYPIGTIYETTSSSLDTTTKMNNHFGRYLGILWKW